MDEIDLVAYDPQWPQLYAQEVATLSQVLDPGLTRRFEHIGSTAIPGLCAKPIIDILIVVSSLEQARADGIAPLLALGYLYWEKNPKRDRLFFVKGLPPLGTRRTHHLHCAESTSEPMLSIVFRDYLRQHADARRRYAQLKAELAVTYRTDRDGYTAAKTAFVSEILALARFS